MLSRVLIWMNDRAAGLHSAVEPDYELESMN